MDLRQLRYFSVLATHQSFARASEVLHIAQPALSRQMRLLEEEFGVRLFDRHARGATPTAEAQVLLERANFLLRYAEQTRSDMTAHRGAPGGPVALGLSPGLAGLLCVKLLRALRERSPEIRLRIVEGFAPALHDLLVHGGIDLAVLNGPGSVVGVEAVPVLSDAICVVTRYDDARLPGPCVTMAQLAGAPLIMTGIAKSGIRLELEAAAERAHVTLNTVVEVTSIGVARPLIEDGAGWSVHFAAAVKDDIAQKRLRALPIEGLRLERSIATATGRPQSRAAALLSQVLRDLIRHAVESGEWPHGRFVEPETGLGANLAR